MIEVNVKDERVTIQNWGGDDIEDGIYLFTDHEMFGPGVFIDIEGETAKIYQDEDIRLEIGE